MLRLEVDLLLLYSTDNMCCSNHYTHNVGIRPQIHHLNKHLIPIAYVGVGTVGAVGADALQALEREQGPTS